MDSETTKSTLSQPDQGSDVGPSPSVVSEKDSSAHGSSSVPSTPAISAWARSLKFTQTQQDSKTMNAEKFTFSRLASGLGLKIPSSASADNADRGSAPAQSGVIGSLTKGIVDSSMNAVKAVQVKARHIVSQNKRRYQVVQLLSYLISS